MVNDECPNHRTCGTLKQVKQLQNTCVLPITFA